MFLQLAEYHWSVGRRMGDEWQVFADSDVVYLEMYVPRITCGGSTASPVVEAQLPQKITCGGSTASPVVEAQLPHNNALW